MAEVTVKQLAQVVGTPIDKLLVQLGDAGIPKAGEADMISDSEKLTLLTHLRESRGQASAGKKITLKRKRVSELKTDASGRKKVNVEVRARRTYTRPGDDGSAPAAEPPAAAIEQAPKVDAVASDNGASEAAAAAVAEQAATQTASEAAQSLQQAADSQAADVQAEDIQAADVQTADVQVDEASSAVSDAAAIAAAEARAASEVAALNAAERPSPAASEDDVAGSA